MNYIIDVANGDVPAKAEATLHDDFIPWKRGYFFVDKNLN
jgi:altronate dehydratase